MFSLSTSYPQMTYELPGYALATGAASGIGLATAQQLAADGVLGILLCDLPSADITSAATAVKAASSNPSIRILTTPADVRSAASVDTAVSATVNSAGVFSMTNQTDTLPSCASPSWR